MVKGWGRKELELAERGELVLARDLIVLERSDLAPSILARSSIELERQEDARGVEGGTY